MAGLLFLPTLLTLFFLGRYLFYKQTTPWPIYILELVVLLVYPIFFLMAFDTAVDPSCCTSDEIFFGVEHRPTAYAFLVIFVLAYIVSRFMSKRILPPLIEVIVSGLLVLGLVYSILVAIHINDAPIILVNGFSVPILFGIRIHANWLRIKENIDQRNLKTESVFFRQFHHILNYDFWNQFPIVTIMAAPVLLLMILILMLFGQKADSIILAFSETYDYGFSTLECIPCEECYICTVGSKGHSSLVRPFRYGIRDGHAFPVNRQLLTFNAFEALLEKRVPGIHRILRRCYNAIGRKAKKFHSAWNSRLLADGFYVLMIPLQWIFTIVVYSAYVKPENKIGMQYMTREHLEILSLNDASKS